MKKIEVWVGLDVGVYETSVCTSNGDGVILVETTVRTSADEICGTFGNNWSVRAIGLETGVGTHLTKQLRAMGFTVYVFDAFQASRYLSIRKNKTDKNDARGIAEITRLGSSAVTQVHVHGPECTRIRTKLKLRQAIIRQRMIAEGMLRTILYAYGERLPRIRSADSLCDDVTAAVNRILADQNIDLSDDIFPLLNLSTSIRKYCQSLDNEFSRLANAHPVCRRLMTIPGVGTICALTYFSVIEDPNRFKHIASIGPYLGLTPRISETGLRSGRTRISRAGDAMTRSTLFMSAKVMMNSGYRPCALADWALALKERVGASRARIALARKLAVVMASIWKSGTDFVDYPPLPGERPGLR